MSWEAFIEQQFSEDYFEELDKFLRADEKEHTIYPPKEKIFAAFGATPLEQTRILLLGQDPYIGEGQAMGLSFSVPDGVKIPPSLRNIFTEIKNDLGLDDYEFKTGNLVNWARQGVLLLNSVMTVRAGASGSHSKQGWEIFTDAAISLLNEQDRPLVAMLWGNYARSKAPLLDNPKHCILQAQHPSSFSAHNGFFGCKHFSQANDFLVKNGERPIDWRV